MKLNDGKHKGRDAIRDVHEHMVHELPPDHPGPAIRLRLIGDHGDMAESLVSFDEARKVVGWVEPKAPGLLKLLNRLIKKTKTISTFDLYMSNPNARVARERDIDPSDFDAITLEGGELGDTDIIVTIMQQPYPHDNYDLLHLGGKGEPGCWTVAIARTDMKALQRWMGKRLLGPKGHVERFKPPEGYVLCTEELEGGQLRFSYEPLAEGEQNNGKVRMYRR